MQETFLWELFFARTVHAGPVFSLVRIQENMFDKLFSECFANVLGELISVRKLYSACIRARGRQENNPGKLSWGNSFRCENYTLPAFAPAEDRKTILANCLCIGSISGGKSLPDPTYPKFFDDAWKDSCRPLANSNRGALTKKSKCM